MSYRIPPQRTTIGYFTILCLFSGGLLTWQALVNAPTGDELGHLFSGIATVQTGDAAYYRVNPPLHKIVSGLPVDLIWQPDFPMYAAPLLRSGSRMEFQMADDAVVKHADQYTRWLIAGRLVRIPLVLLAGVGIFCCFQRGGLGRWVAAVLFLLSPITLGHGWLVMPDLLAGCAMVFLLWTTLDWLRRPGFSGSLLVGIAWGVAIGTKFTFGPLFVVWPIGLLGYQWLTRQLNLRSACQTVLAHGVHGLVAWLIVCSLYGFHEVGVPLEDHGFRSPRFRQMVDSSESEQRETISRSAWLGRVRSPLPKQFLVGVDEQQLDLESGYPTYVLGTWYPEGVWWYYLAGILIKESVAFVIGVGLIAAITFGWLVRHARGLLTKADFQTSQRGQNRSSSLPIAEVWLITFAAVVILLLLSWHSKMALNVRYASPALPSLYLLIGGAVDRLSEHRRRLANGIVALMFASLAFEVPLNSPHWFCYANPLAGGSKRVPPALHDTNFDSGQDLWRLQSWLASNPAVDGVQRHLILVSPLPKSTIETEFDMSPTTIEDLDTLLESREARLGRIKSSTYKHEMIIMRGQTVPPPWRWASQFWNRFSQDQLKRLATVPPDEFITPTVGVYRW